VEKRKAISWDDYFMTVALVSAQRSKDPNTQVGAVVTNPDKRIVGVGYNGFPAGCSDDILPWAREAPKSLDTKYPFVCHAEMNAVLNGLGRITPDCTIYVVLFPCNECAKVIIQAGIKEVVYLSDKYAETDGVKAARTMFDLAGVRYRQYRAGRKKIVINLEDGTTKI